jgi:hypothetical protein
MKNLNKLMEDNNLHEVKKILLKEGIKKEDIGKVENKYKIELSKIIEEVKKIEERKEEIEEQLNNEIEIKQEKYRVINSKSEDGEGYGLNTDDFYYDGIEHEFNEWEYEIKEKEIISFLNENEIKELMLKISIRVEGQEIEIEGVFKVNDSKLNPGEVSIKDFEKKINEKIKEDIKEYQSTRPEMR